MLTCWKKKGTPDSDLQSSIKSTIKKSLGGNGGKWSRITGGFFLGKKVILLIEKNKRPLLVEISF